MVAKIVAVVVNYKTPELCVQLLSSLMDFRPRDLRVVVIDNDSNDGSFERICSAVEMNGWGTECVSVFSAKSNGGFSAGNNLGISSLSADAFLLINSDTYVKPEAIQRLIEVLDRDLAVGIVGPLLEWPDGTGQLSCFNDFFPGTEFFVAAGTGLIDRFLGYSGIARQIGSEASDLQWISFACVLVRADVFKRVGLLDEGYFMYFEDADYCRSARSAGYTVAYQPQAHVVHLRGGSGPVKEATQKRKRRPRYWYASRARYYAKWYGWHGLLAANLFWTGGRMIALCREVLHLKKPHACQREWLDIWTNFWNPLNGPNR